MNEQENTKIAKQLYETFNSSDVEGFLNLFWEDASWNSPDIENLPCALLPQVVAEHRAELDL